MYKDCKIRDIIKHKSKKGKIQVTYPYKFVGPETNAAAARYYIYAKYRMRFYFPTKGFLFRFLGVFLEEEKPGFSLENFMTLRIKAHQDSGPMTGCFIAPKQAANNR